MAAPLTRFRIKALHGQRDLDLGITDNTLVLVGENGSGKTTVLRMLYYFLSGQWTLLHQYTFESIEVFLGDESAKIARGDLVGPRTRERFLRFGNLPPIARMRFRNLRKQFELGQLPNEAVADFSDRYRVPFGMLMEELHRNIAPRSSQSKKRLKEVEEFRIRLDAQVLYLPTYRRIEQELQLIFPGLDTAEALADRRNRMSGSEENYVELIEFGMRDVQDSIDHALDQLKEFARESLNTLTLGYLGDVVDKEYSSVDMERIHNADPDTIDRILGRIGEQILSPEQKSQLLHTIDEVRGGTPVDEHTRVICHYLLKLLKFQENLQVKERKITAFRDVCNSYFGESGKKFVYDSSTFAFGITRDGTNDTDKNDLRLQHLSSGEKQIVSLFSHLYLTDQSAFFVIIDEPELSLSVAWQRTFLLDIRSSDLCSGLVAATHSPFVYENELEHHAHGLGEFVGKG